MFEGLLQPTHLIVIMLIVLVIFGPGKLPELGNAIGKAIRDFKKAMAESEETTKGSSEFKRIEDKQ